MYTNKSEFEFHITYNTKGENSGNLRLIKPTTLLIVKIII